MPVTVVPVGGYSAIAVSSNFANLKTAVATEMAKLTALIPNPDASTAPTAGVAGAAPMYDEIPPIIARNLRAEIAALAAVIAAAT